MPYGTTSYLTCHQWKMANAKEDQGPKSCPKDLLQRGQPQKQEPALAWDPSQTPCSPER